MRRDAREARSRGLAAACLLLGLACLVGGPSEARPVPPGTLRVVIASGHTPPVTAVAFSADGRWLATAGVDEKVCLWDMRAGAEVGRFDGYGTIVRSGGRLAPQASDLSLSDDGTLLAYRNRTGGLTVRNVAKQTVEEAQGESAVTAVAFVPGGEQLLVGRASGITELFDAHRLTKPRRTYKGDAGAVVSAVPTPDGKSFFVAAQAGQVRRWTLRGRRQQEYRHDAGPVTALRVSADGRRLVAGTMSGALRVWDTRRPGRALARMRADGAVFDVSLSPRGERIATTRLTGPPQLWDTSSGEPVRALSAQPEGATHAVAFTPDGRYALTAGYGPMVLYDAQTGEVSRRFGGTVRDVADLATTGDGASLVALQGLGPVRVWDAATGRATHVLGRAHRFRCIAVAPTGARVLAAGMDAAVLYDARTGAALRSFDGHEAPVIAAALDARHAVTGDGAGVIRVFDVETGQSRHVLREHGTPISDLAISPNGEQLASCGWDDRIRVWDLASGEMLRAMATKGRPERVAFTRDGAQLVARKDPGTLGFWQVASGREVAQIPSADARAAGEVHPTTVTDFALAAGGDTVATADAQGVVRLWDRTSGRLRQRIDAHDDDVRSLRFGPGDRVLLTASMDRRAGIWSPATGAALAALAFGDAHWVARTDEGQFDGSDFGQVVQAHAVIGRVALALDQVRQRFYEPGLVARALRGDAVVTMPRPLPPPEVRATGGGGSDPRVRIRVQDRGGGIGPISFRLNGKQIARDARDPQASPTAGYQDVEVDLTQDPRVLPGATNQVEVRADNAARTARSRGLVLEYDAPGTPREPRLFAIVCGVSDYAGDKIDLRYAAKDAKDFHEALRIAAHGLFPADRIHLHLLTSPAQEGGKAATRANLEAAFQALQTSTPAIKSEDVFVLYLAGHGLSAGSKREYHYLLADAASADPGDVTARDRVTMSGEDLTQWMEALPAVRRQVVILDTCASGGLRDRLQLHRVHALTADDLQDRLDTFVLAGCAANRLAYESNQYGQGLLTYALLFGLQCGCELPRDAGRGVRVDVRSLLTYALKQVPTLALDVGATPQQPVMMAGDRSFDLGRMDAAARTKIPLQTAKPRVVRAWFQLTDEPDDPLTLSAHVEDALARLRVGAATRPPVVFVDVKELPGAYRIAGRYTVDDHKRAHVEVFVYRRDANAWTRLAQRKLDGASETPAQREALADALVQEAFGAIQQAESE